MLWEGGTDMKKTFLNSERAIITSMVIAKTPERVKELTDKSIACGAEAIGMQFEQLNPEYRNKETYKELFSYTDKPVYATNYRNYHNEGKSDEEIAEELLELAECGATLVDVLGDLYDKTPGEVTMNEAATAKQMELIGKLHEKGAEVLISSHILKFTPAEKVLEIALEYQRRGADIAKLVVGAENMEEQLENLKIINLLKEKLSIPFLFLSGGECRLLRRIGGEIGCVMYLAVYEHDELAAPAQPLLENLKAIRDNI